MIKQNKLLAKNIFTLFIILLCFVNGNAQNEVEGKTYKALTGHSCKLFDIDNGGCDLFHYSILTFKQDSVFVTHKTEPVCFPEEYNNRYKNPKETKKYKWVSQGKNISIIGFPDLDILTIGDTKLIGKQKTRKDSLVFKEYEEILQIGYSTLGGDNGAGEKITITPDSVSYLSYYCGKYISKYDTITNPYSWLHLTDAFDLNLFNNIESGESNLYFDGEDDTFFVVTLSKKNIMYKWERRKF